MIVTRAGGIIGFSDALTIRADGRTTVSVKGRNGECHAARVTQTVRQSHRVRQTKRLDIE